MTETDTKHRSCPTHCCKIHGCKYGYKDCPVIVTDMQGMTGSCEQCGLEDSGYYGDPPEEEYNQAMIEVRRLQAMVNDLQSGMFINCVYCGHRYGPKESTPSVMSEVLTAHIRKCPKHPLATATKLVDDANEILGAVRDFGLQTDIQEWLGKYEEYNPVNLPQVGETGMPRFMDDYEMSDSVRGAIEQAFGRISALQSKELLWKNHLQQHPGLGASLAACLEKRDIVGAWIVSHQPHPSPPLAVIDMATALKFLTPNQSSGLKAALPKNALEPFAVPEGQAV